MKFSKNQKKRLKNLAKMINSTVLVKKDIEEIQIQYGEEIEEVISEIMALSNRNKNQNPKRKNKKNKTSEKIKNARKSRNQNFSIDSTDNNDNQKNNDSFTEEKMSMDEKSNPPWVKYLWKKIAMKCHPDRIPHFDISEVEKLKRKKYMIEARSFIDKKNWSSLILVGINIEEYVEEEVTLSYLDQKKMLEKLYNKTAFKVTDIQNSIAWQWGNAEDNMTIKLAIIDKLCKIRNIKTPDRSELDLIFQELGLI